MATPGATHIHCSRTEYGAREPQPLSKVLFNHFDLQARSLVWTPLQPPLPPSLVEICLHRSTAHQTITLGRVRSSPRADLLPARNPEFLRQVGTSAFAFQEFVPSLADQAGSKQTSSSHESGLLTPPTPLESMEQDRATRASAAEAHSTRKQERAVQQDDKRDAGELEAWRYMHVLLLAFLSNIPTASSVVSLLKVKNPRASRGTGALQSNAWGREYAQLLGSSKSNQISAWLRIASSEDWTAGVRPKQHTRPQSLDVVFSHDSTRLYPNTSTKHGLEKF
ncbi:hypothetical protein BKA70DRAFT_1216690 [Coprinopsis sp. MPI-PUGE-AT-0042]|nr:hypothetical protein BKA70DRAFT_1216690 [Coprinopsis sp. MPI-PUGE-AT-0042]